MRKKFLLIFLIIICGLFSLTVSSCGDETTDDGIQDQNTQQEYVTAKFVNYDNSVIREVSLKRGEEVPSSKIKDIKPTKPNDDKNSYTFICWNPIISRIYSDTTYRPLFREEPLPYTFKFNLNGGVCDSGISDKKTNRLDKQDFKFDLHKGDKAFRGWQYNGQLIFDKNGNLKNDIKKSKFQSTMTFEALYEDEYRVNIKCNVEGEVYDELPSYIGTVSASNAFSPHEDVSVKANPANGYSFFGWFKGSSRVSTNAYYKFTLWEEDITLTAYFHYGNYLLNVMTENKNYGDIQVKGHDASDTYSSSHPYRENIMVYARKKAEVEFLGWYDENGNLISKNETYSFDMPSKNYTLIAKWSD